MCHKLLDLIWGFIGQKVFKLWRQKCQPFDPGWAAELLRIHSWTSHDRGWNLWKTRLWGCLHGLRSLKNIGNRACQRSKNSSEINGQVSFLVQPICSTIFYYSINVRRCQLDNCVLKRLCKFEEPSGRHVYSCNKITTTWIQICRQN